MDGNAYIFLNGRYLHGDTALIKRALKDSRPRPLIIAVDGGIAFLQKIGLRPDYWLTDLDSAPKIKKGFLQYCELLLFSSHKDKTDAQLALDLGRRLKLTTLTFFGWYDADYETDHLLGNLLLYENAAARKMTITFRDSRQTIMPVKNDNRVLRGYKGCRLSVVPVSRKIKLTITGTAYRADGLTVTRGHTIALRNKITAMRATVAVDGSALVIIAH